MIVISLTQTELLILLLGLLLLQISYSRSVLIPKKRPELVISKIYNPSSGKIDLLVKTGAETPQKQENATL